MQVFLIRHPRPLIEPGRCYGRLDVDGDDPLAVAARLRPQLPAATIIVSSPLRRARQLALALDPQAGVDARLAEIDFGDWEGVAWNAIERQAIDSWAADVLNFTPPGGESVAQLQRRVVDFAVDLAATLDRPRVALVTHAGVIRALLGHWHQLPLAEWTQLQFEFGSLTQIEI